MLKIYMAYYTPEQYELLLQTADDREKLDDKWQDWLVQYIKAKNNIIDKFEVEDFYIDVKKMAADFKARGLKNTIANRAAYVRDQGMMFGKRY